MPYNYLIDTGMREGFKLDLTGAIIIIDEAHNLGEAAEQAQSF